MKAIAFYAFPVFLSALLLFQVQPIIAKYILPWFGGTPAVWTTCMVFFQVALLAGYVYAHVSIRLLGPRRQALLHGLLLLGCLAFLPVVPSEAWKPLGGQAEIPRILALLAVTIGVPYFVLAANGPLLQAWFSREFPHASPYRLFALSNAGSLLALVSYPFLLEPHLTLRWQVYTWSGLFVFFAACCGWCAWRIGRLGPVPVAEPPVPRPDSPQSPAVRQGWIRGVLTLLLPACACVVLLATTNQISQDLPVVPFLWIVPLSLYLLSFIVCFEREMWYWRPVWIPLMGVGLWGVLVAVRGGVDMSAPKQLALYSGGLFACCMVCHGELSRLKPAPSRLTGYYLLISAGGALGGLFVSLVAPVLFSGFWEFQGSLLLCGVLLIAVLVVDRRFFRFQRWIAPAYLRFGAGVAGLGLLAVLGYAFLRHAREEISDAEEMRRGFYGVLRVDVCYYDEQGDTMNLMHGRISHGMQFLDEEYGMLPTSYYGSGSGVGVADLVLRAWRESLGEAPNLRIGVVGLGAGVVAAYGQEGDFIRFYEINPDIIYLSEKHFTYRRQTAARTDVVLGDARLSMERAKARGQAERFDLIVLDAFSGDSIPLHLLTRQAMEIYLYHLKPDGVLAFHISNRYVKLEGPVRALAAEAGKLCMLVEGQEEDSPGSDLSTWVLVTGRAEVLAQLRDQPNAGAWSEGPIPQQAFTDDYSSIFPLLTSPEDE